MKQEYDFSGAKRGVFRRAGGALKFPAGRVEKVAEPAGSARALCRTDVQEFYSRSGSIRFNGDRAAEQIRQHRRG